MDAFPADSETTLRLLEAADRGQRSAFEELFERHRPVLRTWVARRLDRQLAARVDFSDVVQEAQLDAFRQLPSYLARRPMSFQLWLFKTTHQRIAKIHRQHLRSARRAVSREFPLPEGSSIQLAARLVDRSASPSVALERREQVQRIRRLLGELTERDREIVLLRLLDGLSNQEAADVLEIKPDAAKKRYARALVGLGRLLTDAGREEPER